MTGIDDHSRFGVSAYLVLRETGQRICEGLAVAMRSYGVPEEIVTDNGKVFTGGSTGHRWRCCSTGCAGRTGSPTG